MRHALQNSKILLFAGLFIIVIGTSAWQIQICENPTDTSGKQACSDTARPGTVYPDKINLGINNDSIIKAAQASLSAIDFNKIQQQISVSLANINFDEINKNIEVSMKNIDWNKMKVDVNIALDEAKAEIAKIDTKQLKENLEKAKIELKSQQLKQSMNTKELQKQIQAGMAEARTGLEKAKKEISNYKYFINTLQHDGLIKANQPYTIELKDNILYINGVKQSKAITEKYRKYYPNKTHFSIYDNKRQDEEDNNEGTDL